MRTSCELSQLNNKALKIQPNSELNVQLTSTSKQSHDNLTSIDASTHDLQASSNNDCETSYKDLTELLISRPDVDMIDDLQSSYYNIK